MLFLFKTTYNISETGFSLHFHVETTQFGLIDRANSYLWRPALLIEPNWVGFTWIQRQSPVSENVALNKNTMVGNVQKYSSFNNIPLSQTFIS
jgi:hypothetical protein